MPDPIVPDPVVEPTPAAVEPAPQVQASPWAADLETYFEDPAARAAADRYMREKVQPHATQLEQKIADYAPAHELFDDLRQDPLGTYLAMTTELLGAETSDKIAELIAAGVDPTAATEAVVNDEPVANEDPDVARMKEKFLADERQSAWDSEMARIKAAPEAEGVPFHDDEFAVFVSQAQGDFDNALVGYKQFLAKFLPAPAAEPVAPGAPAVLGTQQGGAPPATPPIEKHYSSFEEAMNDTMDEMRANRQAPTVVGQV